LYQVIDLHCDTIAEMYDKHREGIEISLRDNTMDIDLFKMQKGGYRCQCFSLFTYLAALRKRRETPFVHVCKLADYWDEVIARNSDLICKGTSYQDILNHQAAGKMTAIMTVEEGAVYEGKIENLHALYHRGVRISTLTWNFKNELGYPNPSSKNGTAAAPDDTNGLTGTGIEMIREMERLGVLVDISHLNDAGIRDVFRHTKGPVIASHSNTRVECDPLRNLSDEMIRMLSDRGGVTGINFCPFFLKTGETVAKCSDMIRHIQHLKNVGGIDCIALGSDFDGFDNDTEFGGADGMQRLAEAMAKAGFTSSEIEKVFSKNALRVFKEVLR
jgi:membrane dipeptidase